MASQGKWNVNSPEMVSLSTLQLQEDLSVFGSSESVFIDTPYGPLHITVQGDRSNPAIVTCHDLGLNHSSAFGAFLADPAVLPLARCFCWYHLDLPGQEPFADKLPDDYQYPTMTQISEQVEYMADYFQLHSLIAVGVGAGADILARYSAMCPGCVRGLVLINCSLQSTTWTSTTWTLGKVASWQLKGRDEGFPHLSLSYLIRHTFGPPSPAINQDLVRVFRESLSCQSPHNLSLLLQSFLSRSTVAPEFSQHVSCECLFITSSGYQQKEEVVNLVSQMDVRRTTLLEIPHTSGLLLVDQPSKVATALQLFLQGLGLVPAHSTSHLPLPLHSDPPLSLHDHSVPLHSAA